METTMLRAILTCLTALAATAALAAGTASARSAAAPNPFTIDMGTTEAFHVLPYIEQDNLFKLTLKGLSADPEALRSWRASGPTTVLLTVRDDAGGVVARYHLESAWPSEVSISGLKAGSSEVLMETLMISFGNIAPWTLG
jgi:hypothetical protein